MIDYKNLLQRYMKAVVRYEGVSFCDLIPDLTPEEQREIADMADEAGAPEAEWINMMLESANKTS